MGRRSASRIGQDAGGVGIREGRVHVDQHGGLIRVLAGIRGRGMVESLDGAESEGEKKICCTFMFLTIRKSRPLAKRPTEMMAVP